jgi:hypothetical protein
VGLARYLYEGLSVLHYEGTIELTEQECGDTAVIGLGNVLNLTEAANAAWATMNAEIFEITRDFEQGKTKIRIGPPVYLSAQKIVDILRAMRGRIQSSSSQEQQTGKADTSNVVTGHTHAPVNDTMPTPGGGTSSAGGAYSCSDASQGATPKAFVAPGMHLGMMATIYGTRLDAATPPRLVLPVGSGTIYVQADFTYDVDDGLTMMDNEVQITSGDVPDSTYSSGSGTIYQALASYNATVVAGKARVSFSPLISGSQNFAICGSTILNPWLV